MEDKELPTIPQFERIGYKDIVASNIKGLTDPDLPWKTITVGYYHDDERFPGGIFTWAGSSYSSDTIDHDVLHDEALSEGILSENSKNEVPPWGCRLDYNRRLKEFRMAERSSERRYPLDSDTVDSFIEYINVLYERLASTRE